MRNSPTRPFVLGALALALAACGPAASPTAAPQTPERRASARAAATTKDPCQETDQALVLVPVPKRIPFNCEVGACVGATLKLRLRNCSGATVALKRAEAKILPVPVRKELHVVHVIYELSGRSLPPGKEQMFRPSVSPTEGKYRAVLTVQTVSGGRLTLRSATFRSFNGTRLRCLEQGCVWQPGIRSHFCNCPAKDQDKVCYDGSQCEGICLFTGFKVTRPGRCKGGGPKPLGFAVGKCSPYLARRKSGPYKFLRRTNKPRVPRELCWVSVPRHSGGGVISRVHYIDPTAPARPKPRPRPRP